MGVGGFWKVFYDIFGVSDLGGWLLQATRSF